MASFASHLLRVLRVIPADATCGIPVHHYLFGQDGFELLLEAAEKKVQLGGLVV